MPQGKFVSSYFLQALIKAKKETNSAAISMLCYYSEMTVILTNPFVIILFSKI